MLFLLALTLVTVFPLAEQPVGAPEVVSAVSDSDETEPTVSWNTRTNVGLAVYTDDRRGMGTDLFGIALTADAGVVVDNLVPAPGNQRRPALLATRDGGLIVAYEDSSSGSVRVAFFADTMPVQLLANRTITDARAPSLTFDPALGVVLAYAASGVKPSVRVIDPFLNPANLNDPNAGLLWGMTLDAGLIEKTVIASSEGAQLVLSETQSGQVKLVKTGVEVPLVSGSTATRQHSPAVTFGFAQGEYWVAWSEDAVLVPSVRVGHLDPGESSTLLFTDFPTENAPALGKTNVSGVVMATFAPGAVGTRELLVRSLISNTQIIRQSIPRSANAADLTMNARDDRLLLAWTTRTPEERHNVEFGILELNGGQEWNQFVATGARPQREVRVSFNGDLGLAVWREGDVTIRGSWADRRADGTWAWRTPRSFFDAPAQVQLDSLDVSMGATNALIVVTGQNANFTLATTFYVAPSGSFAAGASWQQLGDRVFGTPRAAWDGTQFMVLMREGTSLISRPLRPNQTMSVANTVTTQAPVTYDLDCFSTQCAAAWSEANGDLFVSDVAQPGPQRVTVNEPGPVALANDGRGYMMAWRTRIQNRTSSAIAWGTFAPGSKPQRDGERALELPDGGPVPIAWLALAATNPFVAVVGDVQFSPRTWLVELNDTPMVEVRDAAKPDVAAVDALHAVATYQRFTDQLAFAGVRLDFRVEPDAGTTIPDGGIDAGLDDAGTDAGTSQTDAGTPDGGTTTVPLELRSAGCECSSNGAWVLLIGAVALLRGRPRRS